jgi:ribosomal protein S18 acetylase RimI-like enzyme
VWHGELGSLLDRRAPGSAGRRLGRGLVADVEERIQRAGGLVVFAETSGRAQYAPTLAFYSRCGYEIAAVLNDFYAPGNAKVIFVKRLGVY